MISDIAALALKYEQCQGQDEVFICFDGVGRIAELLVDGLEPGASSKCQDDNGTTYVEWYTLSTLYVGWDPRAERVILVPR